VAAYVTAAAMEFEGSNNGTVTENEM